MTIPGPLPLSALGSWRCRVPINLILGQAGYVMVTDETLPVLVPKRAEGKVPFSGMGTRRGTQCSLVKLLGMRNSACNNLLSLCNIPGDAQVAAVDAAAPGDPCWPSMG